MVVVCAKPDISHSDTLHAARNQDTLARTLRYPAEDTSVPLLVWMPLVMALLRS
eukprot:COSAG02_NODE_4222_length_5616_cov_2.976255_6_plen_54_part_00